MRRLALIATAGIVLAGCGGGHTSTPPREPHYPVVVHPPVVLPAKGQLGDLPRFVSPTRLGIVTSGSSSCPSVPDELVVLGRHVIRLHLTIGSWNDGRLMPHAPPGGVCLADIGRTPMLLAIDPKLIDVQSPLTIHVTAKYSKPGVWTAVPLKS